MLKDADPHIQSLTYSLLGYLNRHSGNHSLAIGYYKKGQAINRSHHYQEWYVSNLVNIINLPLQETQDSMSVYIEELEKFLHSATPDLQAKAYNNIGICYQGKKQWEQAILYFQKAIRTSTSVPYQSFFNLARIYDRLGQTIQSDSLYQKALQSPVLATRALVHKDLYNRYLNAGRYKEAIDCMNRYQVIADSFYIQQKTKEIMEFQLKYDIEKTARQKAEFEARLYLSIITAIGIFLIVSLIGYLYYTYSRKKKHEYLCQIQKQINRILDLEDKNKSMEKEKSIIEKQAEERERKAIEKTIEINYLNHLLKQSRALNEDFLQSMGEWSNMNDIRALGLYIRIQKAPALYSPVTDHHTLGHWLNITADGFANRLAEKHPKLNQSESSVCYLKKIGFSYTQIASILQVKKESINRYIYRTCESLGISRSKSAFEEYINSL